MCIDTQNLNSNTRGYENLLISNFILIHCFFSRSNSFQGVGGVIYFSTDYQVSFKGDLLFFFECKCTGSYWAGGAIHFSATNGEINLNKICGSHCYTTSGICHGQFVHFSLNNLKNHGFNYISVHKCGPNNDIDRRITFSVLYGYQFFSNNNFSHNYIVSVSGLYSRSPKNNICNFSSFIEGVSSAYMSIYAYGGPQTFFKCNIIKNISPTNQAGVIHVSLDSICTFDNCYFSQNSDLLFYLGTGSLIVKNSLIDHSSSQIGNLNIHDNLNNFYSSSNQLILSHFSTGYCQTLNYLLFSNNSKSNLFICLFLFIVKIIEI